MGLLASFQFLAIGRSSIAMDSIEKGCRWISNLINKSTSRDGGMSDQKKGKEIWPKQEKNRDFVQQNFLVGKRDQALYLSSKSKGLLALISNKHNKREASTQREKRGREILVVEDHGGEGSDLIGRSPRFQLTKFSLFAGDSYCLPFFSSLLLSSFFQGGNLGRVLGWLCFGLVQQIGTSQVNLERRL